MSELQNTSALATTGSSTTVEDPQLGAQAEVEKGKHEQLYIDFASDALPVGLASSTQMSEISTEDTTSTGGPPKKIDPRKQWINTDRLKPYYCKLCDFNMETMEVGVVWKKPSLP